MASLRPIVWTPPAALASIVMSAARPVGSSITRLPVRGSRYCQVVNARSF